LGPLPEDERAQPYHDAREQAPRYLAVIINPEIALSNKNERRALRTVTLGASWPPRTRGTEPAWKFCGAGHGHESRSANPVAAISGHLVLPLRKIDHHDVRILKQTFENNLFAVKRKIKCGVRIWTPAGRFEKILGTTLQLILHAAIGPAV
jgi:hypothetical protein